MTGPKTLRLPVQIKRAAAVEAAGERCSVAFSSEAPSSDIPGLPPVVLLHEPGAVDLEPLKRSGSVLYHHDPTKVLGRPENIRLDPDRTCRADILFDGVGEFAREVAQKVRAGSLRGVSVFYDVERATHLAKGQSWQSPGGKRFAGPLVLATRWYARELSLTPTPKDPIGTGVGRTAKERHVDLEESAAATVNELTNQEPPPDLETGRVQSTSPGSRAEAPLQRSAPAAEDAPERTYTASQLQAMRSFARGDAARFDRWIADGVSPDAAREEVFQAMLETHKPFSRASTVEMGADSGDRFRRALTAGMLQRAGYFRAAEWKGVTPEPRTLREIARECVRRQGIPLPGDDTRLLRAASHSTSDFANILLDTLHKAVALSFAEQPSTWARWARPVTASDFRPMSRLILSEAPNLFAIGQQSPVIEGTFNDAARATLAPTTFARRFGISREAFINDDQNIFAQVPQLFGASAARLIDDLVYALLVSQSGTGPNMHDGVAMFHTNHANLGTTGALSLTTLAEARKLMRLQKGSGPNTAILNLTPSVLLTPAALETAAEQLLSSLVVPTKAADLSVGFVRNLELVTEARLDATSATAFYVLAGPANPAIEVAFLNGQRTPQIEQINVSQSVALSGILGFEWVAWIDVGVAALDWRGAVRNAGA